MFSTLPKRTLAGAAAGLLLLAAMALPAAADGRAPGSLQAGQAMTFDVPASPGGWYASWSFAYSGDGSAITFDAELEGWDASYAGAAGFNVLDSQHPVSPLWIATTKTSQRPNDPRGIEFNYSSGTAGSVTVQFFSFVPKPLSVSITQGGLISTAGAQNPITVQLLGAPSGSTATVPSSPPPGPPSPSAAAAASSQLVVPTGQQGHLTAPANVGVAQAWTFYYPGDESNVTFDAELGGLDALQAPGVGFNIFDVQHQSPPVFTATLQSAQRRGDPNGLEFNYSSGFAGTVTLQFFNYGSNPIDLTLSQTGLTAPGGANVPITLQPVGSPAPAPTPTPVRPAGRLTYRSKEVTDAPVKCGHSYVQAADGTVTYTTTSVPCVAQAPNTGVQYIKGRVMTPGGEYVLGLRVHADVSDGTSVDSATAIDGTFSFDISGSYGLCSANPLTYRIWVVGADGRPASDVRTITYSGNCAQAGEFHFDFVQVPG